MQQWQVMLFLQNDTTVQHCKAVMITALIRSGFLDIFSIAD